MSETAEKAGTSAGWAKFHKVTALIGEGFSVGVACVKAEMPRPSYYDYRDYSRGIFRRRKGKSPRSDKQGAQLHTEACK